jgi:hypothetical protein
MQPRSVKSYAHRKAISWVGWVYQATAVLMEAGECCKFKMFGCPDHFVPVVTTEYLYQKNEYDAKGPYVNM